MNKIALKSLFPQDNVANVILKVDENFLLLKEMKDQR